MTNPETLTSEERARIIELILERRAKDNPNAGSGYFAAARRGLEADTDQTLIQRAEKLLGLIVKPTARVTAPTFKESPFTIGETRTFEDGRTGTVIDIAPLFTIFQMDDGNLLALQH